MSVGEQNLVFVYFCMFLWEQSLINEEGRYLDAEKKKA